MSLAWMGEAWQIDFDSTPRKIIALAIADCHNEDTDRCYPGAEYIARKVNLDVGNVRRHIGTLIEEGWLVKEDRNYRRGPRWWAARNCAPDARNRAAERAEPRAAPRGTARVIRNESLIEPEGNQHTLEPMPDLGASPRFAEFWGRYPHRGMVKRGKVNTEKQWRKLKPDDQQLALDALDAYRIACGQFAKDPERYLSHKLWVGLEVEMPQDRSQRIAQRAVDFAERMGMQ